MKEPQKIPLTDNPRCKDVTKISLEEFPNPSEYKTFWKTYTIDNEDNSQNNSTSIQQLESESSD